MNISFNSSLVGEQRVLKIFRKLLPEISEMQRVVREGGFEDARASLNLPLTRRWANESQRLAKESAIANASNLLVIGIGGSNLGTIAVQQAVLGKNYNLTARRKVFYLDTVDPDYTASTLEFVKSELKRGKKAVVNVISKSGSTTETISLFNVVLSQLKPYDSELEKMIVVTTNRDSALWNYAMKKGLRALEIPKMVGGRYSVLSNVGLFPLAFLGVNVRALLAGAREMVERAVSKNQRFNLPAKLAAVQYAHFLSGKMIVNLFLFGNDFESVGKWYRQLVGESLGKEFNLVGKRVETGLTPIVSVGTTDLHSVGQLYLGGPNDKFSIFVKTNKWRSKLRVKKQAEFEKLVRDIGGKSLGEIMDAVFDGVLRTYAKRKRPFVRVELDGKTER
ncbi:hypothetical protein D6817_01645, partial [Candidatus Pacearchaeota archaeon]